LNRGYVYAFLAAICGGSIPTLTKILLQATMPIALSGLVFFLSGLAMIPYRPKSLPTKKSAPWVVAVGLIGAATAPFVYMVGLTMTSAVNVSLLSNGEVFFTVIIAFLVFGERLTRNQLWEGLLIVAGIVIVTTNLSLGGVQLVQNLAGNLLVLFATFCWSVENNVIKTAAKRFGALFVTKYRNIIGGGITLLLALGLGIPLLVPAGYLLPLALLVFALGATSYLAIAALGMLGAIRTILVFSTTSIFGAAFALAVLGEQITVVQVVGGAFLLLGVYLVQRSEPKTPLPSEEIPKT